MDVNIAFIGTQAIKTGLENGEITLVDVLELIPFQHTIDLITLKGKHLRETMIQSASKLQNEGKQPLHGFLQVSG